jgi:hypothetical protein
MLLLVVPALKMMLPEREETKAHPQQPQPPLDEI